jgi:hypothetical protein
VTDDFTRGFLLGCFALPLAWAVLNALLAFVLAFDETWALVAVFRPHARGYSMWAWVVAVARTFAWRYARQFQALISGGGTCLDFDGIRRDLEAGKMQPKEPQ